MSPSEIQAARDELALLEAERTRRFLGGRVVSAGNGGESVSRQFGTMAELKERILELKAIIRSADICAFGAIHLR